MSVLQLVSALTLLAVGAQACASAFDCSLNGLCSADGSCACDSPWSGAACETLVYAVTPASGKNLWTGNVSRNTWNGPIVEDNGVFHLFDPVYEHASLWSVLYYAHGTASSIEGPYDWSSSPNISSNAINPAALVFPNATTGGTTYSLWIGDRILVAPTAAGPFADMYKNPAVSNSAPAYFRGQFFVTSQDTTQVLMASSLAGPWDVFATITHPAMPYTVEDPFLFFDRRGNMHVINHAYNTGQRTNCTSSWVSSHFFSTDGKVWGHSDQPYAHTVQFDDGTSQSFCTLERPSLNFDAAGLITHIHFAADLVTGDEGCASRNKGCVDCKYDDHAGTLLVKLGTSGAAK